MVTASGAAGLFFELQRNGHSAFLAGVRTLEVRSESSTAAGHSGGRCQSEQRLTVKLARSYSALRGCSNELGRQGLAAKGEDGGAKGQQGQSRRFRNGSGQKAIRGASDIVIAHDVVAGNAPSVSASTTRNA